MKLELPINHPATEVSIVLPVNSPTANWLFSIGSELVWTNQYEVPGCKESPMLDENSCTPAVLGWGPDKASITVPGDPLLSE